MRPGRAENSSPPVFADQSLIFSKEFAAGGENLARIILRSG
jgi:hypothetical protein